jgi:hypothetical protein
MNRDFVDMLSELSAARADFLIVGAHALAVLGVPRATGDLDIWIRPTVENAERVLSALRRFGAPLVDLTHDDLTRSDTVFQIGVPPARIDILSGISGVSFDEAWTRRTIVAIEAATSRRLKASTQDWRTSRGWVRQRGDGVHRRADSPLAAMYSDDATNHQVAESPIVGRDAMDEGARFHVRLGR